MLRERMDYDSLTRSFAWRIPERFNIATSVCDRWAALEPERVAILHKRSDGMSEPVDPRPADQEDYGQTTGKVIRRLLRQPG